MYNCMVCMIDAFIWCIYALVIIPSPTKLRRDIVTLPSVRLFVRPSFRRFVLPKHPCEHSKINILNGFWPNLGHRRIWNPVDFQGQRSRSPCQIFRRGDTPRFALPLLKVVSQRTFEVTTSKHALFKSCFLYIRWDII
jgi:hypothetical protein